MAHVKRYITAFFLFFFAVIFSIDPAFAQIPGGGAVAGDITEVAESMVDSVELLPALLSAFAYLMGLLFAVWGIFKLKEHVENPTQTPLRTPVIRFIVGGALFAMPIVLEAMTITFNGGDPLDFNAYSFDLGNTYSAVFGWLGSITSILGLANFNSILAAIISSIRGLPGVITAVAYLLGLVFTFSGLLKLKEHVENPEQVTLKESVIRLLTGGALFALPTLYDAMQNTVVGDGSAFGTALNLIQDLSDIIGGAGDCNPVTSIIDGLFGNDDTSLGSAMCNVVSASSAIIAFLTAISYLFGLVLGLWGILKIQDHVLNPSQTSIWEGVSRFVAAGLFFSLPFITEVFQNTVAPPSILGTGMDILDILGGLGDLIGGGGGGGGACDGLDGAVSCFISDIFGPITAVLNLFSAAAGTILIMIGISRLMKSAQEGARGPGGIGTMMTFLTGGILLSYNSILTAFGISFFGGTGEVLSYGALNYTSGMSPDEIEHVEVVIAALLRFLMIVGMISFVRGIFIVRDVAEGNQQASLMAGVTHMVGGSLAVNLGPLMNAVQTTLGIANYGIVFS